MDMVLLTALGVGGATLIGSLLGFVFRDMSHKYSDIVLSFAAGVMLAAAVLGLILPSVEYGGDWGLLYAVPGISVGALCLNLIDRLTPHLHKLVGPDIESHNNASLNKVLLFVMAIALHKLPEGIAAGVSMSDMTADNPWAVTFGISLQNIPEGMVIIAPLLLAGVTRLRTLLISLGIGLIEVVGVWLGFALGSLSAAMLPLMLGFTGGAMLYVTSDEMIPETHTHGYEKEATYALIAGFITLLGIEGLG